MPVELVVGSLERTLHLARDALALEHRDDEVGRPIPGLAAVQIGEIIVERQHRGDDALFAFCVERVEIVGDPVVDRARAPRRARGADAARDQSEMAAVRFVIIALRAVEDDGENGRAVPAACRPGRALPQRDRRERALRAAARFGSHQRPHRLGGCVNTL